MSLGLWRCPGWLLAWSHPGGRATGTDPADPTASGLPGTPGPASSSSSLTLGPRAAHGHTICPLPTACATAQVRSPSPHPFPPWAPHLRSCFPHSFLPSAAGHSRCLAWTWAWALPHPAQTLRWSGTPTRHGPAAYRSSLSLQPSPSFLNHSTCLSAARHACRHIPAPGPLHLLVSDSPSAQGPLKSSSPEIPSQTLLSRIALPATPLCPVPSAFLFQTPIAS